MPRKVARYLSNRNKLFGNLVYRGSQSILSTDSDCVGRADDRKSMSGYM